MHALAISKQVRLLIVGMRMSQEKMREDCHCLASLARSVNSPGVTRLARLGLLCSVDTRQTVMGSNLILRKIVLDAQGASITGSAALLEDTCAKLLTGLLEVGDA